jgi:RNA polymerase sigma-70 factor (ECF subfamily)
MGRGSDALALAPELGQVATGRVLRHLRPCQSRSMAHPLARDRETPLVQPFRGNARPDAAAKGGAAEGVGAHAVPSGLEGGADISLLKAAANGDAVAFRALVDRHLKLATAIGRRMLRDQAEAEDVAQEAFLRLWRNAATLEIGDAGVRPWLARVVSNLCIDRVRAGRNVSVVAEVPEQAEPARQGRGLEEQALARRVDLALKALPDRQRAALTLFHYEGMSQVEVGAALGVSDEAVESLLARARRALKAALKDEWQALLPDARD